MKTAFLLRRPFLLNTTFLVLALLLSIALGAVSIPPQDLFNTLLGGRTLDATFATIVYDIRLPHALLIALTGAALAGSGAAYQGLFRNPLADPYLIGVASGAGLGAVFVMAQQWPRSLLGFYAIPAAAFIGAIAAVATVYTIARLGKTAPVTTLILAGVAVSSFATALSSFIMLYSNNERRALAWLLGGAALSGWPPVIAVLPYTIISLGILLASGHQLNVLQLGEEQAQQLGLPVERIKVLLIAAASLAAAAAVAFSGMIGFIGLIVPHALRLIWGGDHRRLLPLSMLGGAAALLFADLLARTIFAPEVLPIGILTALAGVPFFLWLLRRAKAQLWW